MTTGLSLLTISRPKGKVGQLSPLLKTAPTEEFQLMFLGLYLVLRKGSTEGFGITGSRNPPTYLKDKLKQEIEKLSKGKTGACQAWAIASEKP